MRRPPGRLLSRGGRTLGIAAAAIARGQRPGQGPWHALSPDLVAATEEVMVAISEERDPAILATALAAALGPEPANAAPAWLGVLDEDALGRLAAAVGDLQAPPAVRRESGAPADPALWAMALAFCRNPDTAAAVADRLVPDAIGARFLRWSRLAQAVAVPGQPSRVRRRLKALLAAEGDRDG